MQSTARREFAGDLHPTWLYSAREIFQHFVDHGLIKNTTLAEADEIVLQRLQLDAEFIRYEHDRDLSKIRKACDRTDRCELGIRMRHDVIAVRIRIWKYD